jgi:putative tricarboxylic transport membrane protein
MLMANILNLFIGNLGLKLFAKALSAPKNIVYPLVIFVCLTGGYLAENNLLAVFIMLVFALLGYFMRKLKLSFVTFIIGFVLGPMLEMSLQQTVVMSWVNPLFITQRPIAMVFLGLTVLFLWRIAHSRQKKRKTA